MKRQRWLTRPFWCLRPHRCCCCDDGGGNVGPRALAGPAAPAQPPRPPGAWGGTRAQGAALGRAPPRQSGRRQTQHRRHPPPPAPRWVFRNHIFPSICRAKWCDFSNLFYPPGREKRALRISRWPLCADANFFRSISPDDSFCADLLHPGAV